jgi:hypothetical protein
MPFRTSSRIFDGHPPPAYVRAIDRTSIFRINPDRAKFLVALAGFVERRAATVFAWALLPNHAHLLLHIGARPLAGAPDLARDVPSTAACCVASLLASRLRGQSDCPGKKLHLTGIPKRATIY